MALTNTPVSEIIAHSSQSRFSSLESYEAFLQPGCRHRELPCKAAREPAWFRTQARAGEQEADPRMRDQPGEPLTGFPVVAAPLPQSKGCLCQPQPGFTVAVRRLAPSHTARKLSESPSSESSQRSVWETPSCASLS